MRSWKPVLAYILLAYLITASAISISVQYLASAQRFSIGHQGSSQMGAFR
jgi:hypothetical protein